MRKIPTFKHGSSAWNVPVAVGVHSKVRSYFCHYPGDSRTPSRRILHSVVAKSPAVKTLNERYLDYKGDC